MYVSSKGETVRSESTPDRSAYPERIKMAQLDLLEGARKQIESERNMADGAMREQHESIPTIQGQTITERMLEKEMQKGAWEAHLKWERKYNGTKLLEEATSGLQSNDRKACAEACEKISAVAYEFPKMVPEEIIIKVIDNLTNNETTKSRSSLISESSLPTISIPDDILEKLPASPAHYYAKSALVSLGDRAMPHLKQALVEGNRQMREKVFEILYEISLNNPELITDNFIPLLCKYASDEGYKAKDIIEVLIKANRTSTSEPAMESEDKE